MRDGGWRLQNRASAPEEEIRRRGRKDSGSLCNSSAYGRISSSDVTGTSHQHFPRSDPTATSHSSVNRVQFQESSLDFGVQTFADDDAQQGSSAEFSLKTVPLARFMVALTQESYLSSPHDRLFGQRPDGALSAIVSDFRLQEFFQS